MRHNLAIHQKSHWLRVEAWVGTTARKQWQIPFSSTHHTSHPINSSSQWLCHFFDCNGVSTLAPLELSGLGTVKEVMICDLWDWEESLSSFFLVFFKMLLLQVWPPCCKEAQVVVGKTRCRLSAGSQDQPQTWESLSPQIVATPSHLVTPGWTFYLSPHTVHDHGAWLLFYATGFGMVC